MKLEFEVSLSDILRQAAEGNPAEFMVAVHSGLRSALSTMNSGFSSEWDEEKKAYFIKLREAAEAVGVLVAITPSYDLSKPAFGEDRSDG